MDEWMTVQVTPVAVPGLMAGNMPVVAFLLQHQVDDPKVTRAVAAVMAEGVLYPAEGMTAGYEGAWKPSG